MARVTCEDIITRGHLMADVPEPSTSRTGAFASEAEMLLVANAGLAALHDLLVEKYEEWLTTSDIITVLQEATKTLLPQQFYKLRRLYLLASNQRITLEPFEFVDMDGSLTTTTEPYPMYRVMGQWVYWHPLPSAERQVEIWYIRQFAPLANRTDEISPELPFGWEEYAIAHVAEYLMGKEERDPSIAIMAKRRVEQRIISGAANRDTNRPKVTPSVNRCKYSSSIRYPEPRTP